MTGNSVYKRRALSTRRLSGYMELLPGWDPWVPESEKLPSDSHQWFSLSSSEKKPLSFFSIGINAWLQAHLQMWGMRVMASKEGAGAERVQTVNAYLISSSSHDSCPPSLPPPLHRSLSGVLAPPQPPFQLPTPPLTRSNLTRKYGEKPWHCSKICCV